MIETVRMGFSHADDFHLMQRQQSHSLIGEGGSFYTREGFCLLQIFFVFQENVYAPKCAVYVEKRFLFHFGGHGFSGDGLVTTLDVTVAFIQGLLQ